MNDQNIIHSLLNKNFNILNKVLINQILDKSISFFEKRFNKAIPTVSINSKDQIVVIGDIHGNVDDLRDILEINNERIYVNLKKHYFVLGDFIDRGGYSFDTALAVFLLAINNPNKFFVIRGNHEDMFLSYISISSIVSKKLNLYSEFFYRYLVKKHNIQVSNSSIKTFLDDKNKKIKYFTRRDKYIVKRILAIEKLKKKFSFQSLDIFKTRINKETKEKINFELDFNGIGYQFYKNNLHLILNKFKDVFKNLHYGIVLNYVILVPSLMGTTPFVNYRTLMVHGGIGFGIITGTKDNPMIQEYNKITINGINKIKVKLINNWRTSYFPNVPYDERSVVFRFNKRKEDIINWEIKFLKKYFDEIKNKKREDIKKLNISNKIEESFNILLSIVWSDISVKNRISVSKIRGVKRTKYNIDLLFQNYVKNFPAKRTWGPDITKKFLKNNNLNLIIRGHQPKFGVYILGTNKTKNNFGFRVHGQHNNKVITIHSNSKSFSENVSRFHCIDMKDFIYNGKYPDEIKFKREFVQNNYGTYLLFNKQKLFIKVINNYSKKVKNFYELNLLNNQNKFEYNVWYECRRNEIEFDKDFKIMYPLAINQKYKGKIKSRNRKNLKKDERMKAFQVLDQLRAKIHNLKTSKKLKIKDLRDMETLVCLAKTCIRRGLG